jgi:hypothetical protein
MEFDRKAGWVAHHTVFLPNSTVQNHDIVGTAKSGV